MILNKGSRLYSILFQKCPRCHEGALFVSVLVAFQILNPAADILYYILATIGLVVVLLPLTYRISRAIWINFFFSYEASLSKEVPDMELKSEE